MVSGHERFAAAVADRYRIERELGHGGMATVYLAEDVRHRRLVAVKVLRPEIGAALGPERFLREIEIAAGLNHPNILPLHDSGEAAGFLYYVMPFVEGASLRDRLRREKQLPVPEALRITREIAAALGYAHSRGVIHRDIKPENVLFSSGHAVVTDFGIARAISLAGGSELTATGVVVGTPGYMSPEQASGAGDLDARTDVYGLGCVLYEMLSGEMPHTGGTAQAILARVLTEPVRPIHPIRETVSVGLDAVVAQALARAPADRFATAAAFVAELDRAAAGGPAPAPRAERPRFSRRLVVAVGVALAVGALGWWATRAAPGRGGPVPRLAVLPLENLGGDSAQEYFVDGLTDALTGTLAQITSLQVISRTSAMTYKSVRKPLPEIARELRAGVILEGSVTRADGRVRVRVQLVDGRSDAQLWTREYERELRDILVLQSDIARDVAEQVSARLTAREAARLAAAAPVVPQAHEEYLRGRFQLEPRTPEGFQEALDHFRQALAIDPAYALAYAGLADYYRLLPFYANVTPAEAFAKSRAAVQRALALDPSLAGAHAALAYLLAYADWNWAESDAEFRRALALNPNDADTHHNYSRLLAALGRLPEAEAEARRAHELDPLSLVAHANLGVIAYFGRDYPRAIELLRATLEINPDFSVARWGLGLVYEQQGQLDSAVAQIEKSMAVAGRGVNAMASLAHVLGQAGRRREAEGLLGEVLARARTRRLYSYQVAIAYAGLGRPEETFTWLERAFEERSPMLSYLRMDPRFDPVRGDPRFARLLRRLNL